MRPPEPDGSLFKLLAGSALLFVPGAADPLNVLGLPVAAAFDADAEDAARRGRRHGRLTLMTDQVIDSTWSSSTTSRR